MNATGNESAPTASRRKPLGISMHLPTGAAISAFLGTLAVIHYLLTTQFGSTYYGVGFLGSSLASYVMGTNHNMELFGAEALFITVTRFLLVFGLAWLPVSALLGITRK